MYIYRQNNINIYSLKKSKAYSKSIFKQQVHKNQIINIINIYLHIHAEQYISMLVYQYNTEQQNC